MKNSEAVAVVRMLTAGFHREALDPETIQLWVELLEPIDGQVGTDVALEWIKREDRFPTIAQFRHTCYQKSKRDEPKLSAAVELDVHGLPVAGCPPWVVRWKKARAAGDMRVFEEQIVGRKQGDDDPRYTREEAEAIGLMPEDAYV